MPRTPEVIVLTNYLTEMFRYGGHQNKKCDFYYKYRQTPRCCLQNQICPVKLPILKCPLYDTKDCCERGGDVTLYCESRMSSELNIKK
jgi:hypothetical protein